MTAKSCLCLVAWHLNPELLEQLQTVAGLDVFLVSHRPQAQVPSQVYTMVPEGHFLSQPNLGYDWGAYQQFLDRQVWRAYDFLFFAHDDISLRDPGVFHVCQELILSTRDGYCIVGNGRQGEKRDYPRTHIQCYAHSRWKPPGWDFEHDVVRGSFFATSAQAMHKIQQFEVLWDRHGWMGVGAGNWSLRATCGRIQATLGEGCFQYLSQEYRSSPYIVEHERGRINHMREVPSFLWRMRYHTILLLSRWLMTRYMDGSPRQKELLFSIMQGISTRL